MVFGPYLLLLLQFKLQLVSLLFFPGLVGQQHNKKEAFFLEHNQCITFLFWQWKGGGGGGAEILRKDKVSC